MKINYVLDDNNVIIGWSSFPFDENQPYIEIEEPDTIRVGIDKIINGVLEKDDNKYSQVERIAELDTKIQKFKLLLAQSDYKLYKFMDGAMSEEEYAPIRAQRKNYRDAINQLEKEIESLK